MRAKIEYFPASQWSNGRKEPPCKRIELLWSKPYGALWIYLPVADCQRVKDERRTK